MNPRTTGILFVLLAGLGAFVWFYEIQGEAGRKDAEAAAKRLFPDVEASAVDEVELTTSDGQRARLARREVDWELVAPLTAAADGFAADAIAAALAQLASEAVFETPQPLTVYGLDDESRDLVFRAGDTAHRLRLGKPTPVGGNRYGWVEGQSRVFTLSGPAVNAFGKSLDDLREKRLLRFDVGAAERVTVRWPEGRVALARGEAGWQLTEPIVGPADETTVEDLLNDLSFLRATGFVDAPTAEQEALLAEPALEVEVTTRSDPEEGGEGRRLLLAIGAREGGEGDRLARAGGPALVRIPSERLQDFPLEVASYRFRELSRFETGKAERLEIAFAPPGGETVTITAVRKDGRWTSTPEAIEPEKLASMLDALSRLRATRILADAMGEAELRELGLAPAIARFTVSGEKDPLAQVELGIVRGSDGVIARASGGPTVYLLAPTVADVLPASLEALRGGFLVKPEEVEAPEESASETSAAETAPE